MEVGDCVHVLRSAGLVLGPPTLILIPATSIGAEWGHLSVQSPASAGLIKIWVAEMDQMGGGSVLRGSDQIGVACECQWEYDLPEGL